MGLNNHILDFHTEVSKGLVPKHTLVHKFGQNLDIDTTTDPETVWSVGSLYTFPTVKSRLEVSSNDNDDILATGTGARKIKVFGLDGNYNLIEEEVLMRGTLVQTTNLEFIRVFRAFVIEAGSSEVNEGTITINHIADSITVAQIPAEHGQTQMAVYTIPANHKGYLTSFSASMSKAVPSTAIVLEMIFRKDGVKRVKQNISIDTTGSTSFIKEFKMPLPIEEKTDIYVNAKEVSQNNSGVFSNFALVLVEQSDKYTTNV
jgi:hypothetical protein